MKKNLVWFILGITIVVAIAAVVMQSTSVRVLYASQMGCRLDSDVYNGGGTDNSAALQAGINLATVKGYKFIVDGPALISTNLVLPSNTRLEFLPGAGFFMAPHANCWVLGNQQNTNYSSTNIWIEGGILNCNGNSQAEYVTNGFQNSGAPGVWGVWFAGVDGLVMRDTKIMHSKTYALLFSDSRNGLFENITCMWTNNVAMTNTYYGTDSFHSQGYVTNVHVNGLTCIRGNDDVIALMTDETDLTLRVQDPRWTTNSGAMKNITIENVLLDKGVDGNYPRTIAKFQTQGSTNALIENLTIRNLYARGFTQGLIAITPPSVSLKMPNLRLQGLHLQCGSGLDALLNPVIKLNDVQSDSVVLDDIYITDTSGVGMGVGLGLIGLGQFCTNVFLSNIYGIGSANNQANNDPLISLDDSVANVPNVSIQNVTARKLGGLFLGGVSGKVRISNYQLMDSTALNIGTSTNIFSMPTNTPSASGMAIASTSTTGETAWTAAAGPSLGIVTNGGSGANNSFTNSFTRQLTNVGPLTLRDSFNLANSSLIITNGSGALYIQNAVTQTGIDVVSGAFWGSGAHLTGMDASQLTIGTLNDARLSANIATLTNLLAQSFFGIITNQVGFSSPGTNVVVVINPTGVTNNYAVNATAILNVTNVSFVIVSKNPTTTATPNSPVYTSSVMAGTSGLGIPLHPGWAITNASGLSGRLVP